MDSISLLSDLLLAKGSLSGLEAAWFLEQNWEGPLPRAVRRCSEHLTDYRKDDLKNTLVSMSRLIAVIFEMVNECEPKDNTEEIILERIWNGI